MYKKHELDVISFDETAVFAEGVDQGTVSGEEMEVLPDDD